MFMTRPAETALFSAVVIVYLVGKVVVPAPQRVVKFTGAVLVGVLPALVLTVAHNKSVTGDAMKLPYVAYQEEYGIPQTFAFQKAIPSRPGLNANMQIEYEGQRARHDATGLKRVAIVVTSLSRIFQFYIGPLLLIPLLAAMFFWRTAHSKFAFTLIAIILAESLFYGFYFAHYAGAITGLLFLVVAMGFAALRQWRFRGQPTGLAFARLLALTCCMVFGGLYAMNGLRNYLPESLQIRYYLWDTTNHNPHRYV
jgi:hypothetical protein